MDKSPTVMIKLDRLRELRCSHKAMKRWSAYTGKSINALDTEALDPEGVEVLMFFMLEADAKEHGEILKLEQMEELLDMVPLGVVYSKLGEAVTAAFSVEDNTKNSERAASGAGKKA